MDPAIPHRQSFHSPDCDAYTGEREESVEAPPVTENELGEAWNHLSTWTGWSPGKNPNAGLGPPWGPL
ncbi:jg3754 [Pararge aegeria aegeria]|uniref:Jg3754 protein n=1 Tax=Pararge aegeria aegeria TaxID=348720 RepID=A0A8S4QUV1_9NEOP|nr:jg3754 [Pararge aegeria aegeria]